MVSFFEHLLLTAPYRMVFVSLSSTLVFLLVVWFVTKVYPRKQIPYIILLVGLSILPLVSILRPGTYESGDLTINVAKLMSFYNNLSEGNLIPRWSGELNATYGYPNFIFAYPLPYYIGSIFRFLGFSFLWSIKLILIFDYLASGIVMFYWLKNHVKEKYAFLGAVFYLFAPYHFVDMHFRVDIGEMTALVFFPLTFLLVDLFLKRKSFLWKLVGGISVAMLILSHQAVSLLGFPIIIIYTVYQVPKKTVLDILNSLFPLILGLLFSSYYWIPVLVESKYTHQLTSLQNIIVFPELWEFVFSKWRYGLLFQGPQGELSPLLGYPHIIAVLIACYLLIFRKANNKLLFLFLILFIAYSFLLTKTSGALWNFLPILRKIEFPSRILSVLIFLLSVIAAQVSSVIKKRNFIYLMLFIAVFSTILNWGNRRNIPEVNDNDIMRELPLITSRGEGLYPASPIWVPAEHVWQKKIPAKHLESVNGTIEILSERRKITDHYYETIVLKDGLLKENTYFFPGWELKIDGKPALIQYTNSEYPGIITFEILRGPHFIELHFVDTFVRYYSLLLSVITLGLSGAYLLFSSSKQLYSMVKT